MTEEAAHSVQNSTSESNLSKEDAIRIRAYELYERRGREDGHDVEDWLNAEAEIGSFSLTAAA